MPATASFLSCLEHQRDPILILIPSFHFTAQPSSLGIPKARVKEGGKERGRPRRQLDTCDVSQETHTIPEFAFHLRLGGTHTCPMQQPQPCLAAAALGVTRTTASFTGSVAGLTFAHVWVAIEARATVPDTAATYRGTQTGSMKVGLWWV